MDLEELARQEFIDSEGSMAYDLCAGHFGELGLLRSTIESLIAREESLEIERIAPYAETLPADARGAFWAENHPYWWEHIIAPQFRAAYLTALLSAVELHLRRVVDSAGMVARAPIRQNDLKGDFYPRSRRFLQLFCGIAEPSEKRWERISDLQTVRNTLVHAGGFVSEDRRGKRIIALSKRVEGLRIETSQIELQSPFCEAALHDCHQFIEAVWSQVILLCKRQRATTTVRSIER